MTLKESVKNDLIKDEGLREFVYDDSTGKAIVKNSYCDGFPTIGVGRNLQSKGLSADEIEYLLSNDLDDCITWCYTNFNWFENLSKVRQRVIVNMRFQLGAAGLLSFKKFINACALSNWTAAANHIENSLWYRQTPNRAKKMRDAILSDLWPE